MKLSKLFLLLSFLGFISFQISAEIITIPDEFTTIQEGIIQAVNGDTVLVSSGTYFENIDFLGKDILLTSHFLFSEDHSFIEQTIIDGSNAVNPDTTSTIVFCNDETESAIIQGFTIRGGGGTQWVDPQLPSLTWFSGGGIFMYYASPTIRHNHIKENIVVNSANYDGASGGGLLCFRGNPTITNNIFSLNQADYGAGIVVDYSGAIIKNNLIIDNSGGQQYGGGGFYFIGNDTEPIIVENNTIAGNHSETTGGAMRMWTSNVTVRNNIMWGNTQNSGGPIDGAGASSITYCNVEGGFTGEGNIDLDPLFIDEEYYILNENSPCIDAGNPDPIYNDPENPNNPGYAQYPCQGTIINDMGVYGGPFSVSFQLTSIETNTIPSSKIHIVNYPNPFNPSTTISFTAKDAEDVELIIFNIKGQKVKSFNVTLNRVEGQSSIIWDGKDEEDKPISSGVYLYKVIVGKFTQTKKMLLMR